MIAAAASYAELQKRVFDQARLQIFGDPEQRAKQAAARSELEKYRTRPIGFVRECLGERTWPASRATHRARKKHAKVAVCGCRKSTKSHTSAQAALEEFCTGPSRTIVTSATYTQMRENVFARIRHLHAHAKRKLPGRVGVTSVRGDDAAHYILGMSTNKPGNTMGFHADVTLDPALEYDAFEIDEDSLLPPDPKLAEEDARRSEKDAGEVIDEEVWRAKRDRASLFFILDEMAEVRADILEAMHGSWMGDLVHVLGQFNPTFAPQSDHPAARALRPGSGWYRIHIAGREPPPELHGENLFDECFHVVPAELMTDAWVSERLHDWGPDSALTSCHVYGLPANLDREWQFVPFRVLATAIDREMPRDERLLSRHIGWDVATTGDMNSATLLLGNHVEASEEWHNPKILESADHVLTLAGKWGVDGKAIPARNIHVDFTGMGQGPVDHMRRRGFNVDAVDFGGGQKGDWERLTGEQQFASRKAELLWVFRRLCQEGLISIPRTFRNLITQAQWYTFVEKPRATGTALAVVEDKPEIKKLFGRSPDDLESLLLALSRGSALPTFMGMSDLRRLGRF